MPAYECERCPLHRADPGPEIRLAFDVYLWAQAAPVETRARRWETILATEDERLIADVEEIATLVERYRSAQANG